MSAKKNGNGKKPTSASAEIVRLLRQSAAEAGIEKGSREADAMEAAIKRLQHQDWNSWELQNGDTRAEDWLRSEMWQAHFNDLIWPLYHVTKDIEEGKKTLRVKRHPPEHYA
jgi:hypothetical protein